MRSTTRCGTPLSGYAVEARRRVKEQLKRLAVEFYDVHFYHDQETLEEKFISVPEQVVVL